MKKFVNWTLGISFVLFFIIWGVIGFMIINNDYDFMGWACAALVCWGVLFACILYKVLGNRCPHCGRLRKSWGKFCPHCGQEIGK